ncbi:hypothetical protein PV941_11085, partial [Ligilactobacillus salivarius]|nr:hypothetical protein [Ligilactobacillus salivarius]
MRKGEEGFRGRGKRDRHNLLRERGWYIRVRSREGEKGRRVLDLKRFLEGERGGRRDGEFAGGGLLRLRVC